MDMSSAINYLEGRIGDAHKGLPEDVFIFLSKISPLPNVDLLIKDERGRVLLSWRDDPYAGMGWHVPGGILRFRESFVDRIRKVAESEIGAEVLFDPNPIAITEFIEPEDGNLVRGHSIAFLYRCFLESSFIPLNKGLSPSDPGFLLWHERCPENLIKAHKRYLKQICEDVPLSPGEAGLMR